ncbi:APC5 protein [Ceratocystis pirilliformis]|uniref:Anaphase-promoting complex subunit 5 n=1 Tax=Ceratocystis pirilliformis TaxID=259994 RepID=A0ABR3YG38_9PEZI
MRYLTPAKIGLLVLIDMYVNDEVPNESHRTILDFLTLHIMGIDLHQLQHKVSPKRFYSEFGRIRFVDATVDLLASMSAFQTLLSPLPSKLEEHCLWNVFICKMWSIDSLNEINVFVLTCSRRLMTKFTDTLLSELTSDGEGVYEDEEQGEDEEEEEKEEKGEDGEDENKKVPRLDTPRKKFLITQCSPIGVFIRQCRSEILKYNFAKTARLWKSFICYRQPTLSYMRTLHPNIGKYSFDDILSSESETWSPEDISTLAGVAYGDMLATGEAADGIPISMYDLERLVARVRQAMVETRGKVSLEVRHQLEDLLGDAKVLPKGIHHLRYIEASQSRDYTSAFDQLHRFCDYSPSNKDRQAYQCSLMTLAQTNSDFGCFSEAATAMSEAISTARENGDTQTLIHCLNWMYNFSITHPALLREMEDETVLVDHRETLSYLKLKSAEVGLPPSMAGAYFLEANLGLQTGTSMASIAESATRASHLVGSNGLAFMLGLNAGTKARIWVRMGVASLALMEQEVFIKSGIVFADLVILADCMAYLAATYSVIGRCKDALSILADFQSHFGPNLVPIMTEKILKSRGVIRFRQDLNRGDFDGAQEILRQLLQNSDGIPYESSFNSLLQLEYLYHSNQLPQALELIEEMAKILDGSKYEASTHVRLLIMKARIFNKCQTPLRGFSIATRAAKLAMESLSVENICEAMEVLANLLNSLGNFGAALELLNATLPRALETASVAIMGETYLCLADTYMGMAGELGRNIQAGPFAQTPPSNLAVKQANARKVNMEKAAKSLDRAFEQFQAMDYHEGQCNVLAKKATIFRILGESDLAEKAAGQFLDIRNRQKIH